MVHRDFVPIPIGEFLSGMTAPVDLYIKMSSGRFVLLFKEGGLFDTERLSKYKNAVDELWVEKKEYAKISTSSIQFAESAMKTPMDTEKKTHFVSNAATAVYRNFDVLGINVVSYHQAEKVTESTVKLVEKNFNLGKLMKSLNEIDDHFIANALGVSILSTVIGQKLGWETIERLKKLSLGGLLCDIGKKHLPPEVRNKALHDMSHEELKSYHNHPRLGAEMLKGLEINNEDLMTIVFQHHERNNGTGFPQKLKALKIHPMAKIVGLAAEFIEMVMPNPKTMNRAYSVEEALKHIEMGMGQPFDKDAFVALQTIVAEGEFGEETLKGAA